MATTSASSTRSRHRTGCARSRPSARPSRCIARRTARLCWPSCHPTRSPASSRRACAAARRPRSRSAPSWSPSSRRSVRPTWPSTARSTRRASPPPASRSAIRSARSPRFLCRCRRSGSRGRKGRSPRRSGTRGATFCEAWECRTHERRTRAPARSTGARHAPRCGHAGPNPELVRPPAEQSGAGAWPSWLVDESVAEGKENGLELRVDAELVEDACDVVALGADADPEPVGDRLAVEARGEGLEHLAFAVRQAGNRLTVLALLLAAVAGEPEQLDDLVAGQEGLARA